jgi:hypothetical protein
MRIYVLLMVFLLPAVLSELHVKIDLAGGMVKEEVTMRIAGDYERIHYISRNKPVSVDYEGEYLVEEIDGRYILEFPYSNETRFIILYEGLMTKEGRVTSYRSGFVSDEPLELSVTLPATATLADEPSAIPLPDSMTTDGRRITLHWSLEKGTDIMVFYMTEGNGFPWLIVSGLIIPIFLLSGYLVLRSKRKMRERMDDLLTDDEKLILESIQNEERQDRIAKSLGFSKSKMSKVVRKLEEKNLLTKEVYFKTNRLKRN